MQADLHNQPHKIRCPDMVVGRMEGKEITKPNYRKVFPFAGTDSKVTQHGCLYEGKAAQEKLDDPCNECQKNFYEYKMPGITDIPPIDVFIMEKDAGAGGVGEPGLPGLSLN